MVISASVCTWLRLPGEPSGYLRSVVLLFVGSKRTWDADVSFVVVRPMIGMTRRTVLQQWFVAGIAGFALCFPSLSVCLRCLTSWSVLTRRTVCGDTVTALSVVMDSGMCTAGFAGYGAFRAVFPSAVDRPLVCTVSTCVEDCGVPQIPFFVVPVVMQGWCLVQTVQKFAEFLHAVLGEVGQVVVFWGADVQLTAESPQVQSLDVVVDMPVGVLTGLQLVDKVLAADELSQQVNFLGPARPP